MHLLMIGGSDAGISAALRARELDPSADVTVIVADAYPNFSICGIRTTCPARWATGATWPTAPSLTWKPPGWRCGWTPPRAASTFRPASFRSRVPTAKTR